MVTYSVTRWWSHWEVIEQVSIQFGDVFTFLQREDLGSAMTTAKLVTFFTDPQKKALLEVKLAAIMYWGKPFITATYLLGGWQTSGSHIKKPLCQAHLWLQKMILTIQMYSLNVV